MLILFLSASKGHKEQEDSDERVVSVHNEPIPPRSEAPEPTQSRGTEARTLQNTGERNRE